jgi:hypothetical protein
VEAARLRANDHRACSLFSVFCLSLNRVVWFAHLSAPPIIPVFVLLWKTNSNLARHQHVVSSGFSPFSPFMFHHVQSQTTIKMGDENGEEVQKAVIFARICQSGPAGHWSVGLLEG